MPLRPKRNPTTHILFKAKPIVNGKEIKTFSTDEESFRKQIKYDANSIKL